MKRTRLVLLDCTSGERLRRSCNPVTQSRAFHRHFAPVRSRYMISLTLGQHKDWINEVRGLGDLHLPSQIQLGGTSPPAGGLQETTWIMSPSIKPPRRRQRHHVSDCTLRLQDSHVGYETADYMVWCACGKCILKETRQKFNSKYILAQRIW